MAIVRGREIKPVLQIALLIVFAIPIVSYAYDKHTGRGGKKIKARSSTCAAYSVPIVNHGNLGYCRSERHYFLKGYGALDYIVITQYLMYLDCFFFMAHCESIDSSASFR